MSQERESPKEEIQFDPTERIFKIRKRIKSLRKILSHMLNAAYFRIYHTLISIILF